ncbi:hypothetical protein CASFOL_020318 [Castilleja foliolosa]|uniref:Cellulose synthase-like protein G3 n=1 Tax=Castilleja foliolosa TaxID=1961234 RepID=A0ABD3D429_9LAMI
MSTTTKRVAPPPLHHLQPLRRRHFNRLFAAVYIIAILSLLRHHILTLLHSTTLTSFITSLLLFISDVVLSYMWSTTQAYRMNPVRRKEFPENLEKVLDRKDFPALDIFICTADPYKEPPVTVVNTALSVMAYDYPTEKLSVYVSDDGGSELTMFAFMEAAKFGKHWLAFCKENHITDTCPEVYFSSNYDLTNKAVEIKVMYETMKTKVESMVERGKISEEYISSEEDKQVLSQYWANNFSRQNHPSIIKVLLNCKKDTDIKGGPMPNLIYISRQKSINTTHHFKAGALNTLGQLRVSAIMTNSPIILTLDCDMFSNDPLTAQRVLCYLPDKSGRPNCGYVQFPQSYHGLNKADIYASEHKRLFIANPVGMDGLNGPSYVGTGCFFRRRVFFGGLSLYIQPEIPELSPDHIVDKPIESTEVLGLAHCVARCDYENQNWGSKMGFRYGSLVEDYYTGFRLQCEGWESIYCNPVRPAFMGDVPITLIDSLNQVRRWDVGLLEVGFSKYSPLTFGIKAMGVLMGQSYAHYAFWPIWSIPITIYAFLPSLALLQGIPVFPKVYEPTFFLYMFLFLGAYAQDCFDFISAQGTFLRWWSDQRMWLMRLSSHLFGSVEFITKCLGMATHGFTVTSKVMDDDLTKRYDQGMFEFGIASPMFVPLAMAAILNLASFISGLVRVLQERSLDSFFVQIFLAGFGVVNSLPLYGAMFLRSDKGRMPTSVTIASTLLVGVLYGIASLISRF